MLQLVRHPPGECALRREDQSLDNQFFSGHGQREQHQEQRVLHCVRANADRCILRGSLQRVRVHLGWGRHYRLRERRRVREADRERLHGDRVNAMFPAE